MNILFYEAVGVQKFIAHLTGLTYEEVNIWGYCIIGPVIFRLLYMVLNTLLCYKSFKWNQNVLIKASLILFFLRGIYVAYAFPSIHDMANHIHTFYTRCDAYIYGLAGYQMKDYLVPHVQQAYINVNVWVFIIIGPLLFLLLAGASMVNLCTIIKRIKTWQTYTGIIILFISSIAMLYGINILKTLLY